MVRNGVGVGVAVVALVALGLTAQEAQAQWRETDSGWCEEGRRDGDRDRHCLTLEASFADAGEVSVDAGQNGGVSVEGWEGSEIEVRAKVSARAEAPERAREIAEAVEVRMERGRLRADGPDTGRRESWSVSFEILVPRDTDVDVETHNGGIGVTGVDGRIRFSALNGGVRLVDVSGDVVGHTTNGGLHVELSGTSWDGRGLDVETTNGGVTVRVPEDYSARLETGTVNGGIDIDFPVRVQGRIGRRLATTLGEGGPTIRAVTTNGGVKIQRGGRAIR